MFVLSNWGVVWFMVNNDMVVIVDFYEVLRFDDNEYVLFNLNCVK